MSFGVRSGFLDLARLASFGCESVATPEGWDVEAVGWLGGDAGGVGINLDGSDGIVGAYGMKLLSTS